jgi:predicted nucleotidyltransferase
VADVFDRTSLSDVERRTLARLVDLLRAELGDGLRAVWLFGSRARGEPGHEDSDVDVLVVTDRGRRDFRRVQQAVRAASEAEGFPFVYLSAHVRDPAHIAHKREIEDFFHDVFVKTTRVDPDVHAAAAALQREREEVDYEAVRIDRAAAEDALAVAERFVAAVRALLA